MDYKEIMEQANKLEAQAAALRKQAEEAKAKDTAKIKEARAEVFAAMVNYFKENDIAPEAKEIEGLNRKLTKGEYEEVENYLYDLDLENGYIQELGEHEEEYVPKWEI